MELNADRIESKSKALIKIYRYIYYFYLLIHIYAGKCGSALPLTLYLRVGEVSQLSDVVGSQAGPSP